ncbi:hypothetical protein HCN44_003776 [Aphidius gifuensis]|uniref:Ribosome biogenesis protein BRX1 homolog n=1 Tax=Aphidius gifuensis TaxID=684658 RepID=A0A834XIT9_APHGI|nr:hypothetical protein HCN44_003776 [Aphidius gifuensis]
MKENDNDEDEQKFQRSIYSMIHDEEKEKLIAQHKMLMDQIRARVYTMGELKLTGNCLKGSRPILSFDENFSRLPHYALLKELLTQIFGVPNKHPKSKPFFDHVYTFSVLDNRIWFRNYQILTEDGGLAEIGLKFRR